MKKLNLIFIILLAFTFSISCNNPLNRKYNDSTLEKDLKDLSESKKIEDTDKEFVALYIVRAKMLGEKLEEKTYAEILEHVTELKKQKMKEDAEQKELAEMVANAEMEKATRFAQVLTVAMYNKGYYEADYQDYLSYSFAFQNNSDKIIRAIKGTVVINDLFDTKIKAINLTCDNMVRPNSTIKETYTSDYNQFMDEDTRLRTKDIKDLKIVWQPEKIIFEDGTTLE